jgi:hypothetical protein
MMINKKLFLKYMIIITNITFLIISIVSFHIYFKDSYNSNYFTFSNEIYLETASPNSFLCHFTLANFSDHNIENINAFVDVYDKNMKLISTGRTQFSESINLKSKQSCKTAAKISINENINNIKLLMIIPYSKEGTGKIAIYFPLGLK